MARFAECRFESSSAADTERYGRILGEVLRARLAGAVGTVVDLRGELGAGKTHFVRGLASGLGVDGAVRSPTFTICHVHAGATPLYHYDAYRVVEPEELLIQGWNDMQETGVVAVEWGGLVDELLPPDRLQIWIEHLADERRSLRLVALGTRAKSILDALPRCSDATS